MGEGGSIRSRLRYLTQLCVISITNVGEQG